MGVFRESPAVDLNVLGVLKELEKMVNPARQLQAKLHGGA